MNLLKKKPFLQRKKIQNTSLSHKELSIILGGILGDGSLKIHPGYRNARYSFRHSIKQKSYFMAKANSLKNLRCPKSIQLEKPDSWSSNQKYRFSSRALTSLTEVHFITHPSNNLQIKRKWLNHLTEESLAIWWFDNGSIIGGGRKGCISRNGFIEKEINILIKYLKVVWNIEARAYSVVNSKKIETSISVSKRKPYRLYFSTTNLKKLLKLILPYLPCEEMLYKCILKYKDKNLQERWISQVKELLPMEYKDKV